MRWIVASTAMLRRYSQCDFRAHANTDRQNWSIGHGFKDKCGSRDAVPFLSLVLEAHDGASRNSVGMVAATRLLCVVKCTANRVWTGLNYCKFEKSSINEVDRSI
jgi:hypothetical protein